MHRSQVGHSRANSCYTLHQPPITHKPSMEAREFRRCSNNVLTVQRSGSLWSATLLEQGKTTLSNMPKEPLLILPLLMPKSTTGSRPIRCCPHAYAPYVKSTVVALETRTRSTSLKPTPPSERCSTRVPVAACSSSHHTRGVS